MSQQQPIAPLTPAEVNQLVLDLINPEKRDAAMADLSKRREQIPDLATMLWHSCGTISALLQEIIAIYPLLAPPRLKANASNRVCNALALLQSIASHPDTRMCLLAANTIIYLYPFLNSTSKARPYEYLRLTSLGVVGALVKVDDPAVIAALLNTEIVPLSLRIMDTGSELSKTVATFILQKILLDDNGLNNYICSMFDRFVAVANVLNAIISNTAEPPTPRLLKHVIRCYLRLTDNPRARDTLKQSPPEPFVDGSVVKLIQDDHDPSTRKWLSMLYFNLGIPPPPALLAMPGPVAAQMQQPQMPQMPQQPLPPQQQMMFAAMQQQQGQPQHGNPYAGMPLQQMGLSFVPSRR